ncbi:FecR family protein [Larkinella rosea]|uniref:FecR family protein n=1 Tax=Larkinella rosea TaxID=2025312 RepID=A0A3P1BAY2_9BACT|nr:FecR family protein [Larkinella rosea]RRA98101.1 FecR family protein [Larkinella rosea]
MSNYLPYTPEEFATDDYFIHWVLSTDLEAETFWQNWLETYPFKRNEVETARQLVLVAHQLPEPTLPDSEIAALKQSVFDRIDADEPSQTVVRPLLSRWYWAAAVLAGLVSFGSWYFMTQERETKAEYAQLVKQATEKYDLVEVENQTKPTRLIVLPDGSSVLLKKGSKLSYPTYFNRNVREIYLTGEAFFEIAKDPTRPFYVFANEIVTKVLGTSFNVRAFPDDKRIQVTVKTGKVSVYEAKSPEAAHQAQTRRLEGLILNPGQKVVFSKEANQLEANVVKQTVPPVSARQPETIQEMAFEYDETPVSQIFSQLEKTYSIRIAYDHERLGNCPVTASLTDEPLYEKLKLTCRAIRAHYEIVNGEVVVTGKGCN